LSENGLDLLIGLGLSPNQAKVYQTLLKSGNATVGLIAKSSTVRREDVYKVLPTLEKMGLVEKLLGKPAIFRAAPVAGALTSLILDEKVKSDERISSMKEKFKTLARVQWIRPINIIDEESLYALIPEGKAVLSKLTSIIDNSKIDLLWIAALKEIIHVTSLSTTEIKSAIHSEVNFRVLIEDFKPNEILPKQVRQAINSETASIKLHHQPLYKFAVSDGKAALISTHGKNEIEETSALWTTDRNLIGVLQTYFEAAWNESKELN
jgi:sugar-specific transcriptional regulator TrmB